MAEEVLREFQVLLQHSPPPIGSTRMLQLVAINMFAVYNSQPKGTSCCSEGAGAGERPRCVGASCSRRRVGGGNSASFGELEWMPEGVSPTVRMDEAHPASPTHPGGSVWSLLLLGLCCDATKAESLPLGLELCLQGLRSSLHSSRCLAQPAPRVWEQGHAPQLGGGSVGHA